MSREVHSHPLENDSDEDDYNNNLNNYNNHKRQSDSSVTCSLIDLPVIPPRIKTKQQSVVVSSYDNSSSSSKAASDNSSSNSDKWNDYSRNELIKNMKAITIEPVNIQPQQVRWLYKDDSAASSSAKWIAFNGLDSLNLETEYLLFKQSTPAEYAKSYKLIQVMSRLFEVDIVERKCTPIYWEGAALPVMRGTWFHDQSWEPLDEELSDRIELEHVHKFKEQILNKATEMSSSLTVVGESESSDGATTAATKQPPKTVNEPIYLITYKEQTIYWYAPNDVYLSRNKSLLKVLSFGNKKLGTRINRGYKTNAESDDHTGDITHLVFVVHGIAQKLFEKSIVKNCDDLRKGFEQVKAKFYGDTKKDVRCEFIPVDWRSSLTLDDGIVETITPQTLKVIRNKLNSSALDIMYYTSPLFRNEIMNGLSSELNRLYNIFCDKNPYFKAKNHKVSIIAHSLGSVIIYDILTHNNSSITLSNTYGEDMNQEAKRINHFSHNNTALLEEYMKSKKRIQEIEESLLESNQNLTILDFQPENLINMGSPLAVFLALRGVRPSGSGLQDHILPKKLCKHLFNLFHPCDAVAYRLEPLVLKHYSSISPLEIHKANESATAKRIPYKDMQNKLINKTADLELSTATVKEAFTAPPVSFSFLRNKKEQQQQGLNDTETAQDMQSLPNRIANMFSSSNNNINLHDAVDLEKRLDYVLPASNFELISALTSHTCYWTSLDVALFIVNQLLDDEN